MRVSRALTFLLVAASSLVFGQDRWTLISSLERVGVHHARIVGRVTDMAGQPVGSARVLAVSDFRGIPNQETRTAADGRFVFEDVDSPDPVGIVVDPPEHFIPGAFPGEAVSGRTSDLGDLRLAPNTIIRAELEIIGKKLKKGGFLALRLEDPAEKHRLIVAEERGDAYVFDRIDFEDAILSVEIFDDGFEYYVAPIRIQLGKRDRAIKIRVSRVPARLTERKPAHLEYIEKPASYQPVKRHMLTGKLVNAKREPVPNAIVSLSSRYEDLPSLRTALTGSDGRFSIEAWGKCSVPDVMLLFRTGLAESKFGRDPEKCDLAVEANKPIELRLSTGIPLEFKVRGDPGAARQADFRWWHPQRGWLPLKGTQHRIPQPQFPTTTTVAAFANGYMPVVQLPEMPGTYRERGAKAAPQRVDVAFDFESSTVRRLIVQADGRPVSNAHVDIEWIENVRQDRRIAAGSFRTSASGGLELRGEGNRVFEAFVYSDGFEPARVVWKPGTSTISLIRRDATLRLSGLNRGQQVRIKAAGVLSPVAVVHGAVEGSQDVSVAAGSYEASLISETGELLNSVPISAASGEAKEVSFREDRRPRVVVQFPDASEWAAGVSRFGSAGTVSGWAAFSFVGGQFTVSDPAASLENQADNQWVFRVAGAGRYQVEVGRRDLGFILSRAIEVPASGEARVQVPELSAQLQGSMKTYKGGVGFSHHGWAGPRLLLLSERPDGWDVTVSLPNRDANDAFSLKPLPEGSYHLFQHLIGEDFAYKHFEGKQATGNRATDAWGGIPVRLAANTPARLMDFSEYRPGTLRLRLLWSDGEPIRDADLYVRDRMSDAWQEVARGPTTLAYADDPIPLPPVVRLSDGTAEFSSVRKGLVEFVLKQDEGRALSFRRDVDTAVINEIRLLRPLP